MNTVPHSTPQGKHYTYTLAYPDGRVFYVGKGSGHRIYQHEIEARSTYVENPYKCNVIRKIWADGGKVVRKKAAFFDTHEEATELEIALIFLMRPYGNLTNLTDGGDGAMGTTVSAKTRQKMSASRKGKPKSEAHRKKISTANMGNHSSKGRTISKTHREKLSAANMGNQSAKGYVKTKEHREKLAVSHQGKVASDTTKQKLRNIAKAQPRANGRFAKAEAKIEQDSHNQGYKRGMF